MASSLSFANARVLVVGDIMLDRYWTGPTTRVSPEAPVPIVAVAGIDERLGGAGNVAANVAALGANVTLIGVCGDDAEGQTLVELCKSNNVQSEFVVALGQSTTVKLRVLSRHQQLIRLDFESVVRPSLGEDIAARCEQILDRVDVLVLSDYAKGALTQAREIISLASRRNIPVVVDPKSSTFLEYQGADVVTPNMLEFETVVGKCADHGDVVAKGRRLAQEREIGALLVTRGEHGMILVPGVGDPIDIAAQAHDVFDVTGAGDTVCAVVAAGLACGKPLGEAIELANAAAGIAVTKLGAAAVSAHELSAALVGPIGSSATDHDLVLAQIKDAQREGKRLVMTNGCFDLLHAGHVAFLEEAAAHGDALIVAVNSDASVTRLKGETRPVMPLSQRLRLLSALKAVDWVISFDEDTPRELVAEILPDVLVKGGDYKIEEIAGGNEVMRNGGQVKSLKFHDGLSTTALLDRLGEFAP